MIVRLGRDELWPLYTIEVETPYYDYLVDLDEATIAHINQVMKDFWEVQELLDQSYLKAFRGEDAS